jgi:hypothetical protein
MWVACGYVMRLWRDWGRGDGVGGNNESSQGNGTSGTGGTGLDQSQVREGVFDEQKEAGEENKEARWRRAWKLAISRKYVRRYVEELEQGQGEIATTT